MGFKVKDLELFSTQSGVYIMKDVAGAVLYVGKAKNIKNRLKQYFSSSGDGRAMIPFLIKQIEAIETIITPDDKEALILESTLIKKYKPKYNALLKDDKSYLSLYINTKDKWPKIQLIRSKGKPEGKGLYFGPYTHAYAARQTLDLLAKLFPLRQCSDEEFKRRTRPCLLYGMKRCIAPCVGKCTKEEYDLFVKGAIEFLRGNDKSILKSLNDAMKQASKDMEYERAAAFLQTIRQIEHVLESKKVVVNPFAKDLDAIGIYREASDVTLVKLLFREGKLSGSEKFSFSECLQEDEELLSTFLVQHYHLKGIAPSEILLPIEIEDRKALEEILEVDLAVPQKGDKKNFIDLAVENAKANFKQDKDNLAKNEKLLLDLQDSLSLNNYPEVIECFDTSNISGSDLVACKIAFVDGKKDKSKRRLFRIKGVVDKPDDYRAMEEVLTRRLTRGKAEDDLPDLIIVDGGKGQLNVALNILKKLDIAVVDVIGLAKEDARHDKGSTQEKVYIPHESNPIIIPKHSPLLFLLQKIRDEAHRTAIEFHKTKRKARIIKSSLDEIEGIGPIKKRILLSHFGSVERLKKASLEDLLKVEKLTKKDAETLIEFFKKNP